MLNSPDKTYSPERPVTIRERGVIYTKPQYGRYDEYKVVQVRRVLSRHDLHYRAVEWCRERNLKIAE